MRLIVLGLALVAAPVAAQERCPESGESREYLSYAFGKYYECTARQAVELEPSGEDARTVAIAAENSCPVEFELLTEGFDECFGERSGQRLAPEMRAGAVTRATAVVVKIRADRASRQSP